MPRHTEKIRGRDIPIAVYMYPLTISSTYQVNSGFYSIVVSLLPTVPPTEEEQMLWQACLCYSNTDAISYHIDL